MARTTNKQLGFSTVEALIIVAVIGVVGVTGWFVYQHNRPQTTNANGGTQTTNANGGQQTTTTPTTTLTYSSGKEHASFKYPNSWSLVRPILTSNDANNTDQVGLTSPSGSITISYVTDVTGFGNEHTASYPYNVVVDKTAITGAAGLYVVSGITTLDGATYYPWIAVQDSNGILTTGVQGNLATFTSRHALNPTTNTQTRILFATCGPRTSQNSPALTKDQATAWLSGPEAQQAKQIMLSYSDAQ